MNKARKDKTVYSRKDTDTPWSKKDFDSVSLAKKANGLNSTTITSPKQLPGWKEEEAK